MVQLIAIQLGSPVPGDGACIVCRLGVKDRTSEQGIVVKGATIYEPLQIDRIESLITAVRSPNGEGGQRIAPPPLRNLGPHFGAVRMRAKAAIS